jgi:UDP-N-acetylglucosamine--N-acetylmuramyl-(pentapeptide) pyrophosphoryl-undecaprenol N-acetylglucosamine transferase
MKTISKVVISGGGTGGHIFPALAIANEIKKRNPKCEFLFVGAIGKMEMEKVPAAGYKIIGLPISGLSRKISIDLLKFPFKVLKSYFQAKKLLKSFEPEVVIGVGGYASAPTLFAANKLNIPTLIQEQNSFAGLTNKILGKKVKKVCVAFPEMEKFFPMDKVVITGNPVRRDAVQIKGKKDEAMAKFNLDSSKKTILIIGGSLGARTINEAIKNNAQELIEKGYQLVWQCGKYYEEKYKTWLNENQLTNIHLSAFIFDMNLAYSAADIVISRAGAISISELTIVQKPCILIPSPNVAEDHQTINAKSLLNRSAALMIKDTEASDKLIQTIYNIFEPKKYGQIKENLAECALLDADELIVNQIELILNDQK